MKKAIIFILFIAAFAGCKDQKWSEQEKQFWQQQELKELERLDSLLLETRIGRQLSSNNDDFVFSQGIELEPHQIAFIEECKAKGYEGCVLTINNQQTYLSFKLISK
jgi:hypothetical protein